MVSRLQPSQGSRSSRFARTWLGLYSVFGLAITVTPATSPSPSTGSSAEPTSRGAGGALRGGSGSVVSKVASDSTSGSSGVAGESRKLSAGAGDSEIDSVERFLNVRSATLAGLSPDGKTVAFTTNTSGSAQIWTVPAAGGWPEQITFFSDRVSSVDWSPRGDWIAFSKDAGGDENFQLYLVSPDGSDLVALTNDPSVRHNVGGWSRDGRRIAFSTNERDKKFFDVYVLDVDTREKRRIVRMDAQLSAGPISNDGKKLLVSRQNRSLDNDLLLADLTGAGEATVAPALLTQHEGIAAHRPIGWSRDDGSIWLVSDVGREFLALGRLDVASKRISWIKEPRWDVTSGSISFDRSRIAFVTNEDGYDTLTVLDTSTLKPLPGPKAPPGQVSALRFSQDGRALAVSLGSPTRSGDVWLGDLASGSLTRVTRSSTAGILPSSFVEPELAHYKSFDGLQISAFFYHNLPKRAPRDAGLPCIVMPHGGPESQTTARFSTTVQYLASRGYAVWAPNVRGSTGYGKTFTHLDDVRKREDSVKDLIAGVEFLKRGGVVDPSRIAVMGGSYGGYMTLAAITLYPDLWAAAVDSYGIANFKTFFKKTASYRADLRASEYGDPEKDSEFLDAISPIHKVDRIRAPLLVLQGANDPRVPQAEAEQIVAAVKAKGGIVEYVLFPDEGHGWTKLTNQIKALRQISHFLDRHLKRIPPESARR